MLRYLKKTAVIFPIQITWGEDVFIKPIAVTDLQFERIIYCRMFVEEYIKFRKMLINSLGPIKIYLITPF